jgi:hypothetical protein
MPTLTKARTAQLCNQIRLLNLRAAACTDFEHSFAAVLTREIGLGTALFNLVLDLGGSEGALALNEALQYSPTSAEITAYHAQQLARQQQYLAAAVTTPQVPA